MRLWLVVALVLAAGNAWAAKPHDCDREWCKEGHFVSLDISGTVSASTFIGDGSGLTGISGTGGATPASPTTSVQFNNAGALGGAAEFVYVSDSALVSLTGNLSASTIWGGRYQAQLRSGLAAPLSSSLAIQDRIVSGTSQVRAYTVGGVSLTVGGEATAQLTSQTVTISGSLQTGRYKANILTGLAAPQ